MSYPIAWTASEIAIAALVVLLIAIAVWGQIGHRRLAAVRLDLSRLMQRTTEVVEQTKTVLQAKAALEARYSPIMDLDAEKSRISAEIAVLESRLVDLRASYVAKKSIFDHLSREVAVFDERLALAELGVYEPHFDFEDSEEFKRSIESVRERQKHLIECKTAVICGQTWTVDGNVAKGQAMVNRGIRLTLRAFNNECDAAIANARWNNVSAMEKRIIRAYEQLNSLNKSTSIEIVPEYLNLKVRELLLTHEYKEKLKAERTERAELARAQREELKLQRDIERAEEEENKYRLLLEKAKAEAESSVGPKLQIYTEKVSILSKELEAAREKLLRAQSMAERTKSGYVYIISNVGSFGPDVVKIGVTRRLDPADRIRELGDASVPFFFDTHAIIYSDDAPGLERSLHCEFEAVRVNTQNARKEFFRASIEEVEAAVTRLAPGASFFRDVEAQEYRETLAKRNARLLSPRNAEALEFPAEI